MAKSIRTTLILFVTVVFLLAWIAIYEKKLRKKNADHEEKSKQLVALESKDVQEIEIVRMKNPPPDDATLPSTTPAEYQTLKLKKTGNDWMLVEPVQDAADNSSIDSMLSSIVSAKHDRIVEEAPADRSAFGLKDPIIKVTLRKNAEDKGYTVFIGKNTPTGYNAYASLGDEPKVYRVSRSVRTAFEKAPADVRKKQILSQTQDNIEEVEIHHAKENITLKRDSKNKNEWWLTRDDLPVDTSEWNRTFQALFDLKATDFVSEDAKDLKSFGLASPTVTVTLTDKKKSRSIVQLGKDKDKVYAKRDDKPVIYEVDKSILEKTQKPSVDYQSKKLAHFSRFDITRIRLERGKEIVELLKENNAWTFLGKPELKVAGDKVDTLLASLQDAKIAKYVLPVVTSNQIASEQPHSLQLKLFEKKDGKEQEAVSLAFGVVKAKQCEVKRVGLAPRMMINEDDYKKFNLAEKDFIKQETAKAASDQNAKGTEKPAPALPIPQKKG